MRLAMTNATCLSFTVVPTVRSGARMGGIAIVGAGHARGSNDSVTASMEWIVGRLAGAAVLDDCGHPA